MCSIASTAPLPMAWIMPRLAITHDSAGIRANSITIKPIDNGQTNTERLCCNSRSPRRFPSQLQHRLSQQRDGYIQTTNRSTTKFPSVVRILTPTNGSIFSTPADILICADARDPDGYVATVEFFAGTNSLGIRTNCLPCAGRRIRFASHCPMSRPGITF